MLGPVLYYDLTSVNEPLSKNSVAYKQLWKLHEQVEAEVEKDLETNAEVVNKIMSHYLVRA